MLPRPLPGAALLLTLGALACTITINLPVQELKTGPTVTEEFSVALLDDPQAIADVWLQFGAGELRLFPGAADALINGTAAFNVEEFAPDVRVAGKDVRIRQGGLDFEEFGIPNFDGEKMKNEWGLALATAPLTLRVDAGAYLGRYELGGLALHSLRIADGAADSRVSFDQPNLVEMALLDYDTGASSVTLTGLGNASLARLDFDGGVGDYTFDFSGVLQRDMQVDINSGVSNIVIIVPEDVAAEVLLKGGLSNVSARGAWQQRGDVYEQDGQGPKITIDVDAGLSNIELRNQ